MTDNRLENLDPETSAEQAAPSPAMSSPAIQGGQRDAIRVAFLARTAVSGATAAGAPDGAAQGFTIRSAFLAHMEAARVEAPGDANSLGGDSLRRAYAARLHSIGAPAAQTRAPRRAKPAKAAKKPMRASGRKAKATAPKRNAKAGPKRSAAPGKAKARAKTRARGRRR